MKLHEAQREIRSVDNTMALVVIVDGIVADFPVLNRPEASYAEMAEIARAEGLDNVAKALDAAELRWFELGS